MDTLTLSKALVIWEQGKTLTSIRNELHVSYFDLRYAFQQIGINKR
jgi:hypothetical protein